LTEAYNVKQESRIVARKPRDAAAVLFGLKFADNIHYKLKSSQASKARLQSSKHTSENQDLTQNGHSRSFKVTCFGVSGKAIRDKVKLNIGADLAGAMGANAPKGKGSVGACTQRKN